MASSNKDLWILDLRNLICTSFGRGWRVNGEQSGRTKVIYVFNEGKGENNPRTTATLNIEWKQQSVPKIIAAIEHIKPLVVGKNISFDTIKTFFEIMFSELKFLRKIFYLLSCYILQLNSSPFLIKNLN